MFRQGIATEHVWGVDGTVINKTVGPHLFPEYIIRQQELKNTLFCEKYGYDEMPNHQELIQLIRCE
jgi:hypothetical protein